MPDFSNPFMKREAAAPLQRNKPSPRPQPVTDPSQIRRGARDRCSTTVMIDGYAIKKLNNYDLEHGEPALCDQIPKPTKVAGKRSAFVFFSTEHGARFREQSNGMAEASAKLGAAWRALAPQEKERFEAMAQEDAERHAEELQAAELADMKAMEAYHQEQKLRDRPQPTTVEATTEQPQRKRPASKSDAQLAQEAAKKQLREHKAQLKLGMLRESDAVMQRRWNFMVRNRDVLLPFVSRKLQQLLLDADPAICAAPKY